MRTTLNLDDDLLERLKAEAEKTRSSLTATVNRILKAWIDCLHPESGRRRRYHSPTFAMGFPPVGNLDKGLNLAAALEDEEVSRKLELRK
ncbi:MAG: DUF2191 domain-containing protein [Candidatus Wallbacteria bacterium]|nr:DUF2191 domain-containing protein [Candidatus Wallbacteria bacterium]